MAKLTATALDQQFCQRFRVCVESTNGSSGKVWISDRTDLSILSYLGCVTGCAILPTRIGDEQLEAKIAGLFGSPSPPSAKAMPDSGRHDLPEQSASDSRIVNEINGVISDCIRSGASDIHFEPGKAGLLCRARLDGILMEHKHFPTEHILEMISRIKIMSGLDIAEKRLPQDGRIRFPIDGRTVDIRVSIIPTGIGEKAVLRLLDKQSLRLDLNELGLAPAQLQLLLEKISIPNGIILVTGPTGSGKTTTLYAALHHLQSSEVNISTVEDPIEYDLEGINQTQVQPEIGRTFAFMLRSFLRQDPDIIMIGEIRDRETLDIAIQASLTGHLVLSTVHTNSAVATVARLLDMGAESYLLASSLKLIIAQRLVRKLCPDCKTSEVDDANRAAARKLDIALGSGARTGIGCDNCNRTGFRSRTGVYELMSIDETVSQAINAGASEQEILALAHQNTFHTMGSMASDLVNTGVTSPVELLRELSA